MTDHLSASMLNALADGELAADQLLIVNDHLPGCPLCTASALHTTLLKAAVTKAGQSYKPSPQFQERLAALASQANPTPQERGPQASSKAPSGHGWRAGSLGWVAAAVLLVASLSGLLVDRAARNAAIGSVERTALVTEVFDQHVATLAASLPPQVLSTDRHTVKPWFQGKIPFSFNLPENLPSDTTLVGANLAYLRGQPTAQLLFGIGKHRVSIFIREKTSETGSGNFELEHAGFHVATSNANDLVVVAVSDVDPARLADLMRTIMQSQTEDRKQPR